MEAAIPRQHTSRERLLQLQTTESLYNAGLYTSALFMTGIQLSTIKGDEKWFQSRALSRYARCLTRLQEHRRSIEYYRKAAYLENSPLPSDIPVSMKLGSKQDGEGVAELRPPMSAVEALLLEKNMDKATLAKQRLARDQFKEKILRTTSKLAAQNRTASMMSSAKAPLKSNATATGLTNVVPTSIPAVVPQSTTMKRHLASRISEVENSNEAESIVHDSRSIIGGVPKMTNKSSAARLAGDFVNVLHQQDAINIDHAQSRFEAGDYVEAGRVIAKISESNRTVKVYLLMVRLAHKKIFVLPEKACWECIAEMQPLAIEAYVQLLRSQVPLAIVLNMIPSDSSEKHWMKMYLKGMDNFLRMRYQAALSDFSALNEIYPDNIDIKLRMALCLKWMSKPVRCCFMFSQVRKLDSCVLEDMYHYGACLKQMGKVLYLNKLAGDLLGYNDKHPDAWCVQGLYWETVGNKERALLMVSRALQIKADHCGALQLRGQLLMETTPLKALQSFREAYRIEKNINTYEGLVNTYVLMERMPEAMDMAKEAKKLMPDSAHALAIYGMAVYHTGDQDSNAAQDILKEALQMDPGCVEAASCLVMIYENQGQYDEAIQILDQQVDYQPPDTVHVRKAEIYTATEQWEHALASYQSALSANPDNARAKEGMAHVERVLNGGDEEDEDEIEESDNNEDIEVDATDAMDAMDVALDRQEHISDNLDEDDVLTGDEDPVDEVEDDHQHSHHQTPQHTQEVVSQRARGLGQRHQQSLYTPTQRQDQIPQHSRQPPQFSQQLQQQRAARSSIPGFGMGYPQTPSRSGISRALQNQAPLRVPSHYTSQREREYDEYEDGGDMDE
ncbi:hypothetical protein BC939DRAFT_446899 [Gamsiella multidivaricata]|uniref:uncharacterized protein n=1 Tax=Gamsiella multidivaricata TaxID=101098 RepID=UPI0022211EBD|nr:uncharacterized protein BC939DRAFT_446899 [Gamsiella multidivaricata]KAG0370945.1 Anaphase-promoting complex subunit 7 [Gamsiella multidivaricata]KAI7826607.1 hypothetical protein BC939DRAFT_446899 [Gamsiella multidivaricata]